MSLFLTPEEVAELTDIRTGKDKRTREERQLEALYKMKIPHYESEQGRPKVARSVISGGKPPPKEAPPWSPQHATH